ncbi:MAG: hypothetical protein ABI867_04035 [Kofleriaceae bacterium]
MRNLSILVLIVAAACGGPKSRDNGGDDDDDTPIDSSGGNTDNCSEAAKLIYTVDENNTLATFDAVTKQFNSLGTLNCPASGGASPFSMGIDRNAGAWVLYSSGELFSVNTETLACVKTTWSSPNGLRQFGMGFSTNTVGGTEDTLYIAGGASPTQTTSALQKLNTASLTSQPVGTVTGWPELTGNGNAELWGWFPSANGSTPRVEQIDKTTGAPLTTYMLPTLSGTPAAWAFAFFGGDYFIFLMRDSDDATTVYQIDGTNGSIKGMTPTNTRTIVGAGVSTCAPVVIF